MCQKTKGKMEGGISRLTCKTQHTEEAWDITPHCVMLFLKISFKMYKHVMKKIWQRKKRPRRSTFWFCILQLGLGVNVSGYFSLLEM